MKIFHCSGLLCAASILAVFLTIPVAQAKYLTIVGEGGLSSTVEEDSLHLIGSYEIKNNGDETARDVFPKFRLGSWSWVGTPEDLGVNEAYSWQIDETLPLEKLSCKNDPSCASLSLPVRGAIPLFVTKHYSDTNGYAFSSPEIVSFSIEELTSEERVSVLTPALSTKFSLDPSGSEFSGALTLMNRTNSPRTIAVSFFTTDELLPGTEPYTVEVPPGAEKTSTVKIRNLTALVGSSYPVYAVIQWQEGDVRVMKTAFASAAIIKPDNGIWFLITGICVFILVGLILFILIRKK